MKLTAQQEMGVRIGALLFPAMVVMTWVSDIAGDSFVMAGVAGLACAIVMGIGYFFFRGKSLKIQMIASLAFTILLFAVIGLQANSPTQKIRRALQGGEWESIPPNDELDDVITLRFVNDKEVKMGYYNLHDCTYEVTSPQQLIVTENLSKSPMDILYLEDDSMALQVEGDTLRLHRYDILEVRFQTK